jgi:1-phosphatidylinositol phosphodiesterase
MSIKREGPGEHTDEQLCRILRDHYYNPEKSRWYTQPKLPTLGEARGKIVLVRRFGLDDDGRKSHNGRGWGIDAGGWADNTPHATCPSGHVCLQDFYEVLEASNVTKKVEYIKAHLGRSAEASYPFGILSGDNHPKAPYYINFLSASNFWKLQTWPEKIAAQVNPATVEYLCCEHKGDRGDWSTGILVCDWVGLDGDWDLVRCIVGMNTKLMLKQRQH